MAVSTHETRKWLASALRKLADDVERQRVLSFNVSMPTEVVEVEIEDGDKSVRYACTGVKGLYVTYTEHPLATERVRHVHETNLSSGEVAADGD